MSYLITGAAGFIGSNLSHALIQSGKEVVLVDRFSDYYSEDYKRLRVQALLPGFEIVNLDLADRAAVFSKLRNKSIETIFHLGAQPGVRIEFPNSTVYLRDNIAAFSNILEFALDNGSSKFLYASSSSVYQNATRFPFTEKEVLVAPTNIYARSKWINEKIAESFLGNGLQILGLRFFSAYGPWGRPDMSYLRMISSSISGRPYFQNGDGTARRDFTFIRDIVESLMRLSGCESYEDSVVNIGGNQDRVMSELVEIIVASTGKPIQIVSSSRSSQDLERTLANPERLYNLINYTPSTTLEEGIRETIGWARKHASSDRLFSWTKP
jgi:UDP-glucuronate 4-epimerase